MNIQVGIGLAVILSITTLSCKMRISLHKWAKRRFHVTVAVVM